MEIKRDKEKKVNDKNKEKTQRKIKRPMTER